MLIIQSFIWFKLTPTLILEISCSNWTIKTSEGMRELFKQEVTSLHNRKCKSSGVMLRLTIPIECIQCSVEYLVFVMQKSNMKKNEAQRDMLLVLLLLILKSGAVTILSVPLLLQEESSVLLNPTYPDSLSWHLLTVCPVSKIAFWGEHF